MPPERHSLTLAMMASTLPVWKAPVDAGSIQHVKHVLVVKPLQTVLLKLVCALLRTTGNSKMANFLAFLLPTTDMRGSLLRTQLISLQLGNPRTPKPS